LDKIIGLGRFGCVVADEFSEYPEYRVYKIDDSIKEKGTLLIDPHPDIESYEKNFEQLEAEIYLRSIKPEDHVLIIVEGGTPISGICLRLAEVISEAKVSILYIAPDREMISSIQKRDDKITFNVFQEYARSGALESIYLVHKPMIERMVGNVAISEYEKSVCRSLAYVVAMVNYFDHIEPVLTTKTDLPVTAKIKTLGISSFGEDQKSEMVFLFPMVGNFDMQFLYGVPSAMLDEDSSMIGKIKDHISQFRADGISSTYSIYSASLEKPMVFCCLSTDKIQSFPV